MEKHSLGVPPDGWQHTLAAATAKPPMNPIIAFLRTTILGGLLFLIPLVLTIILLREAIKFVGKILTPIAHLLPAQHVVGVAVADLLAVVILLGVCFVAGLAARTRIGAHLSRQMEQWALRRVPGFTFFKTIAHGMAGLEVESELSVALARSKTHRCSASWSSDTPAASSRSSSPALPRPLPAQSITSRQSDYGCSTFLCQPQWPVSCGSVSGRGTCWIANINLPSS